ncbi:HD domain-containing phosphohydrolase [Paenibacillus ihuae]|uniref:HD domain-containing phosphohydrolase n=1 Tax=Paenibacillus ihuae TaxID=1232431 RepID=UPI0006D54095|nr:HD domain-containing phosphohydrolase [Paenibacillus ihuae]
MIISDPVHPELYKLTKIMIIDDVRANTLLLEKLFTLEGYSNISVIDDPERALQAIQEEAPEVLLLDLNMPTVSGFDILMRLNEQKSPLVSSVIIITAYQDSVFLHRALRLGVRDFLTKPFDPVEIVHKVKLLTEANQQRRLQEAQTRHVESLLQQHIFELEELQQEYVQRLLQTMKHKDNETGKHLLRISNYVYILAKRMGLDENACHKLKLASALHDIGKLSIPDHILHKEGKLTAEEFEVIKEHTTKGAALLAGSRNGVLILAESIALTHHEKWDGSGYPQALRGEEIPLEGRITAVCDVFDALISKRSYKAAWSGEEALAELQRQSGLHFDPEVVRAFSDVYAEILNIRDKWLD